MRVQSTALFALLALGVFLAPLLNHLACRGIHVNVLNIQNRNGTVDCTLFDSPAGFPREFLHSAQNVMVIKSGTQRRVATLKLSRRERMRLRHS
jgi:uncharacterized protein (DUF2141 family)